MYYTCGRARRRSPEDRSRTWCPRPLGRARSTVCTTPVVGGEGGVLRTEVGHGVLGLKAQLGEGEGGEEVRGGGRLGKGARAAGSRQTAV
jgi:hypothetical protein